MPRSSYINCVGPSMNSTDVYHHFVIWALAFVFIIFVSFLSFLCSFLYIAKNLTQPVPGVEAYFVYFADIGGKIALTVAAIFLFFKFGILSCFVLTCALIVALRSLYVPILVLISTVTDKIRSIVF